MDIDFIINTKYNASNKQKEAKMSYENYSGYSSDSEGLTDSEELSDYEVVLTNIDTLKERFINACNSKDDECLEKFLNNDSYTEFIKNSNIKDDFMLNMFNDMYNIAFETNNQELVNLLLTNNTYNKHIEKENIKSKRFELKKSKTEEIFTSAQKRPRPPCSAKTEPIQTQEEKEIDTAKDKKIKTSPEKPNLMSIEFLLNPEIKEKFSLFEMKRKIEGSDNSQHL